MLQIWNYVRSDWSAIEMFAMFVLNAKCVEPGGVDVASSSSEFGG